jgi:hypothetical protein
MIQVCDVLLDPVVAHFLIDTGPLAHGLDRAGVESLSFPRLREVPDE